MKQQKTVVNVLLPIAQELRKKVEEKFFPLVKDNYELPPKRRKIKDESDNHRFWDAKNKDTGVFFYKELIDKESNPSYLYKLLDYIPYNGSLHTYLNLQYVAIGENYLYAFLNFLEIDGEDLEDKLMSFCDELGDDRREDKANQSLLPQSKAKNTKLEDDIPLNDSIRIAELRTELTRLMYKHTQLFNTKWWFYLYGYDKHRLKSEKENTWTLVKLVMSIGEIDETGNVEIRIDNTGVEHYDYVGVIDFQGSRTEVLVINLSTMPYLGRQLNIKIHVGNCEGDLFLGQYLNYESDNHIISGSVVLQRINQKKVFNPEPAVYKIENLENGEQYEKDTDGVSRFILQYLHDKKQNFHRTPLRVAHSLLGLKTWLETRREEDNE